MFEQELHHARMNHVVGPASIGRRDVEAIAERGRLEIDVVEAQRLAHAIEHVLLPDVQGDERKIGADEHHGQIPVRIVVVAGRLAQVVDPDLAALEGAVADVAGHLLRSARQRRELGELPDELAVGADLEVQAALPRPDCKVPRARRRAPRVHDDCGHHDDDPENEPAQPHASPPVRRDYGPGALVATPMPDAGCGHAPPMAPRRIPSCHNAYDGLQGTQQCTEWVDAYSAPVP